MRFDCSRRKGKVINMTVLFLCTGNTCRSPMAAALMRRALDKCGREDIIVKSAGLAATGTPASTNAIAAMSEIDKALGIQLAAHISQPATPELLREADVIAVMSASHARAALLMGVDADRVRILSVDGGEGIADPYGGNLECYRQTRDELDRAVQTLAQEIGKP